MKWLLLLACSAFVLTLAAPAASAEETAAAPQGEGRRPMTVEDLWAMARVGAPALSPDGRWVAFPVTEYDFEENKGNSDLWLVPADGGAPPRRLTWNKETDSSPAWSPDGQRLAFTSKRGEGPAQLYVLPMAGGEAEPVTDLPIAVKNPKWFPDGRRIAFEAATWPDLDDDFEAVKKRVDERKEDKVQAKISENRLLRYWDHYLTDGRATHLFVLDLESREVKDLMPGSTRLLGLGGGGWDLSPDGAEIAFSANATEPPYRSLNYDIFLLPTDGGGEARNITADNPAHDGSPRYTPDGRYLLYGRNSRPEIAPDYTRLVRRDRESGETRPLLAGFDEEPRGWTVTPDGATVLFHAQDHGKVHLYAAPIAGGEPRRVARGGTTGNAEAGPDGLVVYTASSITAPEEVMALRLDSADAGAGEPRALTAFNAERLAGLDLGTVEDVRFSGAGGDEVQMFVIQPPGFDPARKWPLLHLVHGGPHGAFLDDFHFRWNAALFASPGYVTVMVNFHGSTGSGQAFAESILGNHADKPFTDILLATDEMLARGYIDEGRMAAAGGSYGGYMVSWILGHTDRFAALVNHAGVYDLMSQFASDYTWGRANNYGAEPWEDPERIDLYSPSRYAEHFATPTLVLHGEKDYRVPYTQGLNIYGVLTAKGVPARVVVFPEENHWILKPQSAKVWWGEVFAWLGKYLKNESE